MCMSEIILLILPLTERNCGTPIFPVFSRRATPPYKYTTKQQFAWPSLSRLAPLSLES